MIKNLFLIVISLLCAIIVNSQNPLPTAYPATMPVNFVRSWDASAPVQNISTLTTRPVIDVIQSTQYFDGLGRVIQSVIKQESPLQNDLVSPVVYDPFGRQQYKYLPFIANGTGGNTSINDGLFKLNPFQEDSVFSKAQYTNETYFYSQASFENSPLNRVAAAYAPGNSWTGSSRGISNQYLISTAADSLQIWNIASQQQSTPVNGGNYAAGMLFKNVSTDEMGHQVIVYANQFGETILKKVQLASSPSTGHAGWLCTYYIYDTLQNLRFVIPPQAVNLLQANAWNFSASALTNMASELCYRYEYDSRRRIAIKKVPGAGELWMVYDARDRLIMTQDSALRAQQKWMFIKYDSDDRPDSTGLITDPAHYNNLAYHDTLAYHSTNYPVVGSFTNELFTQTFYDDYSWSTAAGMPSTIASTYTSNSNYFITSYNASPTYAAPITPLYVTRGMPTGSMRKVLGTSSQYMYSVSFYDDRGRMIQTQSMNYTGAIDTVTIQYNFKGKAIRTLLGHKKNGNTVQAHTVLTKMDYDQMFRLRHVWKNIDNATSDQLVDSLQYNELGQLKAKYLGNNVDSIIYDYNIRGWLTGINKSYVAGTANHYFGMELGYDKTTSTAPGNTYSTPEYNGNIEGTVWKTAGSNINRKYDYAYDNVNRLTAANFNQYNGSSFDKSAGIDFSVSNLSYDANSNILTMQQKGFTVGGSNFVDQLKYTYQTNSNKLSQVYDTANNPATLLGDFHYTGTKGSYDYTYDGNGNMNLDNNKSISYMHYNYMNLPDSIVFTGKGYIKYVYDAAGSKLQKVTVDNVANKKTVITYVTGFIYQNTSIVTGNGTDTLQFIAHEEGRIRWAYHKYNTGTTAYKFEYDFFEKDHLGNTRMVLTQQRDTANYLASMEAAYRTTESQLFANIAASCYNRNLISGYPTDNTTTPNDSVARLNGSGQKSGPSLLLKVMSGDNIQMAVKNFYKSGTNSAQTTSFSDILNSLANGLVTSTGGAHGTVGNLTQSTSTVYTGLNSFITNNDPNTGTSYPKAYLNWIFLDDQFNYVSSLSGAIPAASATYPASTLNTVAPGSTLNVNKNGYLYIWVSNETQGWDVFFDNLSVSHKQGPLLEENAYYPFGLAMQGISDKAIKTNYSENKYRYNGGNELQSKEFSDGTGLELYDAVHRMYDPQTGRFGQIDALAGRFSSFSTYSYAFNNPISFGDPSGLSPRDDRPPTPDQLQQMQNQYYGSLAQSIDQSDAEMMNTMQQQASQDYVQAQQQQAHSEFVNTMFNLYNSVPDGNIVNFSSQAADGVVEGATGYNYTNASRSGIFVTDEYHGLSSYTVGENYTFVGTTTTVGKDFGGEDEQSDGGGSLFDWLRLPDYISFNASVGVPNPLTLDLVGWNGTVTLDRYGNFYFSPIGVEVGKSATEASFSLTANWLNQSTKPSEAQLNSFLTGNGFNVGGGFILGGAESWSPGANGTTTATGFGFYTPQFGGSYNYTPSMFTYQVEGVNW
ncbi:MAG TPA: DUF6443 domain-containing protein [Puia sp.]|nr:DUF6443 domain-containing protein [Puia sp.]